MTRPQKDINIPKPQKPDKPPKPDKGAKEVDAAAAKGKERKDNKGKVNKGKDDKGHSPSSRSTPTEMKKKACIYYGFNACKKGDRCPCLHDPNNKY